jgi:2,3,4,5-tetrahydropyridine-2-carboxylate N-succinyltransferase
VLRRCGNRHRGACCTSGGHGADWGPRRQRAALEPLQASPTIIEDNCFIGARSEIVEGVVVEEGAVISMGVFIGQSTRIYDRETGTVTQGRVPAGAVVVPGSLPSKDGRYSLACAVIV